MHPLHPPPRSATTLMLTDKQGISILGLESRKKSYRNFRLFLKKRKTHCIHLFGDNIDSFFVREHILIIAFL